MGLLKHLLFWPVTGPKFLVEFSLGRVHGVVREELTDDGRVKEQLLELQLLLELGDIDDEEYVRRETALMAELRDVQRWREEFGMSTRGPVRVAGAAREEEEAEEREGAEERRGGIASPSEATVDLHFDFEDDEGRG
ncbi:MAG TPA: gas vesicle protein GvpG [Longimicrobiales bacterium]|nr:gas vesicle protein GvpG [Longimicrobiales bacterium]